MAISRLRELMLYVMNLSLSNRFSNVKNLTITNHIAGKTTESKLRMEKEIVNQVLAFCE